MKRKEIESDLPNAKIPKSEDNTDNKVQEYTSKCEEIEVWYEKIVQLRDECSEYEENESLLLNKIELKRSHNYAIPPQYEENLTETQ
jgi:hypothetical protein